MSKLIVDMEMPKSCPCDLIGAGYAMCCSAANTRERIIEYDECVKNGTRPSWCPIVGVLPETHGDLIDRDEIESDIIKSLGIKDRRYLLPAENAIWKVIDRQQAVIAAEMSET